MQRLSSLLLAGTLAATALFTGCRTASDSFYNLAPGERQSMMRSHLASLDDVHYHSSADVAMVGPRETVRSSYTHDPDSHTVDLSSLPTAKTIPYGQDVSAFASSSHSGSAHATSHHTSTASTAHQATAQPAANLVPLASGGLLNPEVIGPSDLKRAVAPGEIFFEGGEESLASNDMLASSLPDQYGGLEYYDSEYVEGPGVIQPPPRPTPELTSMSAESATYAAAMAASTPPTVSVPPMPSIATPEPTVFHAGATAFAGVVPMEHIGHMDHSETLIHSAAAEHQQPGTHVHHGQDMVIQGNHEFPAHGIEEDIQMLGDYPVETAGMTAMADHAFPTPFEPTPFEPTPIELASDPLLGEGMTLIGSTPATTSGDGWHVTHESSPDLHTETGISTDGPLQPINGSSEMIIGQSGFTGQLISTSRLTADGFPIAEPIATEGGNWVNGGIALSSPGHSAITTPDTHNTTVHRSTALSPISPIGASPAISTSEPMTLSLSEPTPAFASLTEPVAYAPKNFSDALTGLEDTIASSSPIASSGSSAGTPPNIPGECHGQVVQPSSGDMVWMKILCANALDAEMVARIQTALLGAGFYTAKIDGNMGTSTRDALTAYQRQNNLARGEVTIETLTRLGLK